MVTGGLQTVWILGISQWGCGKRYTLTDTPFFDPTTGRFLTRDPIGFGGGVNLYAYCRNRVVVLNDRSGTIGLFPIVCSACAVCLAGFALSCYDCGLDASCRMNCVSNIWQNLPTWVKILCGGACIGCGIHIILPGPPGNREPSPLPEPGDKPVRPEPVCSERHDPERYRAYCARQCVYECEAEGWIGEDFWRCWDVCFLGCVRNIGPGRDFPLILR